MGKLPCTSFAICTHIIHGRLIMQAETKGYHILTNNCLLKRSDLAECGLPFCVPEALDLVQMVHTRHYICCLAAKQQLSLTRKSQPHHTSDHVPSLAPHL